MMDISYEIVRSARKTISLQITREGKVVVRCPKRMARRDIEDFVLSKRGWLEKHLAALAERPRGESLTEGQLRELADAAKEDLAGRLGRLAPLVGVSYGRVTIRCQRSRWGSCSGKGNLNFNCLLMLCPEEVRDYVVVHELCHRKQMNHSAAFWAEVERVLPGYREQRKWLREHGGEIMASGNGQ